MRKYKDTDKMEIWRKLTSCRRQEKNYRNQRIVHQFSYTAKVAPEVRRISKDDCDSLIVQGLSKTNP